MTAPHGDGLSKGQRRHRIRQGTSPFCPGLATISARSPAEIVRSGATLSLRPAHRATNKFRRALSFPAVARYRLLLAKNLIVGADDFA